MSSKEEKLLAARKKLREFQGKVKSNSSSALKDGDGSTQSDVNTLHDSTTVRSDSPHDPSRIAWERRKTLPLNESTFLNQQGSRPSSVTSDSGASQHNNFETEIITLREQLARQTQAINLLVGERSNAQATLSKVQSELHQKSDELEELKSRYNEARQHLLELENAPRQSSSYSLHNAMVEDELRYSLEAANQSIAALQEQLCELKSRLNVKTINCEELTARVNELVNALALADVKIQQLTVDEMPILNTKEMELQELNETLLRKVELLERRLQAVAMEGEQSTHRFQMYADQCNTQQEILRSQISELSLENNKLKIDGAQFQYELNESKSNAEKLSLVDKIVENEDDTVRKDNEKLREELQAKESTLEILRDELKEGLDSLAKVKAELEYSQTALRRLEASAVSGRPDPALLAAMESDKVAASRAVAQNQNLKEQLTELQQAFVRLSDEKLELTERLSHAEYECSELGKQLDYDHNHGDDCHDHSHDSDSVEDEADWDLDMYRRAVSALRTDKAELAMRYQALRNEQGGATASHHGHDHGHAHSHVHTHGGAEECSSLTHKHPEEENHNDTHNEKLIAEVSELRRNIKQLQLDKSELLKRLGGNAEDPEVQGLLEIKLKRTMDEIAVLDDEKQRLEHLVLQLQGETETIGEYIALYHKQRLLLKQRGLEKDEQLEQLTKDREELKEKLVSLNELVAKLVDNGSKPESNGMNGFDGEEITAKRIKELITEIGNNSVVNSHSIAFEQCSCCSGRLITV